MSAVDSFVSQILSIIFTTPLKMGYGILLSEDILKYR